MDFACIGFDLRVYPCKDYPSADFSEWDRNDKWFGELESIGRLAQNEYSLLIIPDQRTLEEISKHIMEHASDCDLVAIEIPLEIVSSNNSRYGFRTPLKSLDLSDFVCCGLDVCDIDGLYTCFNHPEIERFRQKNGLIPVAQTELALEIAQFANYLDPKHRPFVVMRIYSLKGQGH